LTVGIEFEEGYPGLGSDFAFGAVIALKTVVVIVRFVRLG
jgi:hypothetical protein